MIEFLRELVEVDNGKFIGLYNLFVEKVDVNLIFGFEIKDLGFFGCMFYFSNFFVSLFFLDYFFYVVKDIILVCLVYTFRVYD